MEGILSKIFFLLTFCGLFVVFVSAQDQQLNNNGYNIFYYPNGQISSEGFLLNGKPEGYWKSFYVNGILKSEGKRVNGLLDSVWTFYSETGDVREYISYLGGKKNGYYYTFSFYKNKDNLTVSYLEKEELYLNNLKNGYSKYYYKNGNVKECISYKLGKKEGITKKFNKEGVLVVVINYLNGREVSRDFINQFKDSLKVGLWKTFYENGNLKSVLNYRDGTLQGLVKNYNLVGELISTKRYDKGILVDSLVEVDDDIDIIESYYNFRDSMGEFIKKSSGGFMNGIPIGVHRTYDSLGRVNSSILYNSNGKIIGKGIVDVEGNKVGDWYYYYKNGNVKSKGKYYNNRRVDLWMYYFTSGNIEQEGYFLNGRPNGIWKWYYEDGKLHRKEFYENGKEQGENIEYSTRGHIITKGNFKYGLKEGPWFYDFNFITEKGSYHNGLKQGLWYYYYNNGLLYFKANFIDNKTDGDVYYYYNNGNIKEKQYYILGRKEGNWEYYDYYGSLLKILTFENNKLIKINGVSIETN